MYVHVHVHNARCSQCIILIMWVWCYSTIVQVKQLLVLAVIVVYIAVWWWTPLHHVLTSYHCTSVLSIPLTVTLVFILTTTLLWSAADVSSIHYFMNVFRRD